MKFSETTKNIIIFLLIFIAAILSIHYGFNINGYIVEDGHKLKIIRIVPFLIDDDTSFIDDELEKLGIYFIKKFRDEMYTYKKDLDSIVCYDYLLTYKTNKLLKKVKENEL